MIRSVILIIAHILCIEQVFAQLSGAIQQPQANRGILSDVKTVNVIGREIRDLEEKNTKDFATLRALWQKILREIPEMRNKVEELQSELSDLDGEEVNLKEQLSANTQRHIEILETNKNLEGRAKELNEQISGINADIKLERSKLKDLQYKKD